VRLDLLALLDPLDPEDLLDLLVPPVRMA